MDKNGASQPSAVDVDETSGKGGVLLINTVSSHGNNTQIGPKHSFSRNIDDRSSALTKFKGNLSIHSKQRMEASLLKCGAKLQWNDNHVARKKVEA